MVDLLKIVDNIDKVIIGKKEQIKLILASWLAGGHTLIEDVPGTGKTVLAKSLAKSIKMEYKRVQFTPDLLPSDILGNTIFDMKEQRFVFRKGPAFTSILLADEINRATPRTQSALLECMAEKQISIESRTFPLDSLFLVLATQNPIEQHGTFPLPEAQLDRFNIKISLGYPSKDNELLMAQNRNEKDPFEILEAVMERSDLLEAITKIPSVYISEAVYKYVIDIVSATRNHPDLNYGASPRATITFLKMGQALALIKGSDYVCPGDIYNLAIPVLAHRISLRPEGRYAGKNAKSVIKELLEKIKMPIKHEKNLHF